MYGVVLWSNATDRKAVIWCEDHGDLAFYNGQFDEVPDPIAGEFDAGDLVQFDIRRESDLRLACNPRVIAQDEYPNLASNLRRQPKPAARRAQADVIPLFPRRAVAAAQGA